MKWLNLSKDKVLNFRGDFNVDKGAGKGGSAESFGVL